MRSEKNDHCEGPVKAGPWQNDNKGGIDAVSARFIYPLPFGAEYLGNGRTRFRVWAPDCRQVELMILGESPIAMQWGEQGMFEIEANCGAGTAYYYRLDEDRCVPDPASRQQSADVHDRSLVCDPRAFRWQHDDWNGRPWHEIVIYELHAGCLGGYAEICQRLPELVELGITAIELMPVADFRGTRNWGYDGVLQFAPDTAYGTPDQLKHLIDTAHSYGLCVYLDVVYNHFGPEGNYLHLYASDFFCADQHSPWGAAIDFSNPQVREFFTLNALYWLMEYRFDGLRLDAVHQIGDSGW
ncbi:MAG: alpha-amylase family glycosyl hydrolase, partial [Pseudomonadota bacterium]